MKYQAARNDGSPYCDHRIYVQTHCAPERCSPCSLSLRHCELRHFYWLT